MAPHISGMLTVLDRFSCAGVSKAWRVAFLQPRAWANTVITAPREAAAASQCAFALNLTISGACCLWNGPALAATLAHAGPVPRLVLQGVTYVM